MKNLITILLCLFMTGFSFSRSLSSLETNAPIYNRANSPILKKPLSRYQLAEHYLDVLKAISPKDPNLAVKKTTTEDLFFKAVAGVENYSQVNSLLLTFLSQYYSDQLLFKDYLNRLLNLYKSMGFKYGEFWIRKVLADVHFQDGNMKGAEKELIQLIREYEKTSFPDLPQCYDLLSGVYLNDAQVKNALATAFETIKHLRCASDSLYLPNFYLRIASIYNSMGNPKTIDWFYKIADAYILNNHPLSLYRKIEGWSLAAARFNKAEQMLKFLLDYERKYPPKKYADLNTFYLALTSLYTATGNLEQADNYFQKHIKLTDQRINSGEIKLANTSQLNIGLYYYNKKMYSTARKYFLECLDHPTSGYPFMKNSNVYYLLYAIDSLQGNYFSAMRNLHRYDAMKDSLFNIAKNKQIEELQIVYETAQKQKDIQILKNNQATQQLKLAQTVNNRNWILAGSVMLLALLGVSYRGYLLKQKSSRMLLEKNKMLQHFIAEKEWLLKEVHHRVKNNLHTVICLLESQAAYLENDALKAIECSQHRIYAMSLIHQKLYLSEDIKTINMATYIKEFTGYLNDSFDNGKTVRFQLDIEPLQLGISLAIPLALIINEAVTNSFKYAFIQSHGGLITINLHQHKDIIILEIADNGIGIDPDFATNHPESLGMKLMNGLSEDINASIQVENCNGTKITLIFNQDPFDEKHDVAEHSLFKQFSFEN